jgi:outer membrane protein TolC
MARLRIPSTVLAALLATGCASLDRDAGIGTVQQAVQASLGPAAAQATQWQRDDAAHRAADARVRELLAQPLSADAAVQLALLNHRGLQADLQELGIAEAERVQALRLPNPGFTFERSTSGEAVEITRSVHVNLARLLVMPLAAQMAARRQDAVQRALALRVLGHAFDTRRAWVQAVAAQQNLHYARQVMEAADAGAELARRMAQAGNWSKLMQAREQGFYADAALNAARAERAAAVARERLTRLLGLWGGQAAFTLPERLPDLPAAANERPDIEREAMAQRLDVQAVRLGAEQLAKNLGLARTTRWVNVLEVGASRTASSEGHRERAWEIGIELPLFDWGDAKVAKAEALYMQAVHRTAEAAANARSQVREAYGGYRSAYDIARHLRDEVLPLKKRISDENLLRYNGMLIGVFDLLADARAQIAGVSAAIDAQRDFWLAEADLQQAMTGPINPSVAAAPAMAADGASAEH